MVHGEIQEGAHFIENVNDGNDLGFIPDFLVNAEDYIDIQSDYYLDVKGVQMDSVLQGAITQFVLDELHKSTIDFSKVHFVRVEGDSLCFYTSDGKEGKGELMLEVSVLHLFQKSEEEKTQKREEFQTTEKMLLQSFARFDMSLDALDTVFAKNDTEWFGELDMDDRLDEHYPEENLRGKTIAELGAIARLDLHTIWIHTQKLLEIGENVSSYKQYMDELAGLEERYLAMIMGIGDKYEGGVVSFKKTEDEILGMLFHIVDSKKTNDELFSYLKSVHNEIDENNHQSIILQDKAYPFLIDKLNLIIFAKLKHGNAPDKDFLTFAGIVSGRDLEKGESIAMDGALNEPKMANQILTHIMGRTGGMLDRLYKNGSIVIEDDEIGKQTPQQVVNEFIYTFDTRVQVDSGHKISGKSFLHDFFTSLKTSFQVEHPGGEYQKLSLPDKIAISCVKRLTNKMKNYEIPLLGDTGIPNADKKMTLLDLSSSFKEVSEDATEGVLEGIHTYFGGVFPQITRESLAMEKDENGEAIFSDVELDIFDLFNQINGNGVFTISDSTKDVAIGTSKFAGVIGGAMLLTALTAGLGNAMGAAYLGGAGSGLSSSLLLNAGLATTALTHGVRMQGMTAGLYGSISSWGMFPQGYSSQEDMFYDLTTDLAVGGTTGALGGWWANGKKGAFLEHFRGDADAAFGESKKNLAIFVGDMTVLGFGAEFYRQKAVSGHFDGDGELFEGDFVENIEDIGKYDADAEIQYKDGIVKYKDGSELEKIQNGLRIKVGDKFADISLESDGRLKSIQIGNNTFKPNIHVLGKTLDGSTWIPFVYFSRSEGRVSFGNNISERENGIFSFAELIFKLEKENRFSLIEDYDLGFDLELKK